MQEYRFPDGVLLHHSVEVIPDNDEYIIVATAALDKATWQEAYDKGYRCSTHPVPAIRYEWEYMMEMYPVTGRITLYMITYGVYDAT